jgi:type II restriction enzyme
MAFSPQLEYMAKDFNKFMSQLQETNQTLDFFCDFDKISRNVEDIKLSLCMLNSLIGSTDMRKSVERIWNRDKSAFDVMDILIAVRSEGKKKILNSLGNCIVLDSLFESIDGVMEFLDNTGLTDIFQSRKINDLVDYVFGIETGLDTNARKNRSGHVMENMVARIFDKNGISYRQEVYSSEWPDITKVLGDDEKRFDFVIETSTKIYLMEVNFYSGGGSKLNEVARSYSDIAPKINSIPNFEFVWITDGIGWKSAKNKLQEAYSIIPSIYNLTNINEFINGIK